MPALSRVAVEGLTDIKTVVLSLAWSCLSDTPADQKNLYFDEFVTSKTMLWDLASDHPIKFAPSLFEMLQSETLPTVENFIKLPGLAFKGWGIYLIVLGKPGEPYRVYIGSATCSDRGMLKRFYKYDTETALPKYYEASLEEGFTVVHRGLLCWTLSIPPPAIQPTFRLLFLLLEATFSYVFWAMRTPNGKDYGMGHICLWDRLSLEYSGLCSHCCLTEGVNGEFSLSAEELEALAVKKKEHVSAKGRAYHRTQMETNYEEYHAKNTAYHQMQMDTNYEAYHQRRSVAASNHYRKQMETNYDEFNARRAANRATYRSKQMETNRDAYRASVNKSSRKAKAAHVINNTYHCTLCNTTCQSQFELTRHEKTSKHLAAIATTFDDKLFVCRPCRYGTNESRDWKSHCRSKRHRRLVADSLSSRLG
jgi:hypothetical protein